MGKIAVLPMLMRCSACGAEARASCGCGAPYVPAGKLAAAAVATNPGISSRAIAARLGVDESTVREARKSTAGNPAVEARTGKDGKIRRMPRRSNKAKVQPLTYQSPFDPGPERICHDHHGEGWPAHMRQRAFINRANEATAHALVDNFKGLKITDAMRKAAAEAAEAWRQVNRKLNGNGGLK